MTVIAPSACSTWLAQSQSRRPALGKSPATGVALGVAAAGVSAERVLTAEAALAAIKASFRNASVIFSFIKRQSGVTPSKSSTRCGMAAPRIGSPWSLPS